MAGLASDGSNPDVSLLYDINELAKAAPPWFDRVMEFVGEYGLMLAMALVCLWCWWSIRRRGTLADSVSAAAGLVWAPLAAGIALLVNIPIRGFVERPRPFKDHQGLEVLIDGKTDFSFVSDHATLAMALGVGVFVAHRRLGLAAIGLALAEGFARVYMGVHYPTDVIGGFALGTAVALLLAPLALALLTPVLSAVARSGRGARLVRSRRADAPRHPETVGIPEPRVGGPATGTDHNDLAA
ncbi:phosphatase PAP2 family protein [Streptomyces sp. NBC_00572]|uniref:phosphatase PAP2 family protein n=1 Tax=Streptomyces sp. NBC_00572 TaxID=2903664 RepID=UPI00225B5641|nr:phosphatase PAP2 family protein [Streptomyces sp. NBC_00572]MCX4982339.1 phosphatase PAP2 family protein [Streptomyces sp. NBC_00572]